MLIIGFSLRAVLRFLIVLILTVARLEAKLCFQYSYRSKFIVVIGKTENVDKILIVNKI
jgi:hypothetical protein